MVVVVWEATTVDGVEGVRRHRWNAMAAEAGFDEETENQIIVLPTTAMEEVATFIIVVVEEDIGTGQEVAVASRTMKIDLGELHLRVILAEEKEEEEETFAGDTTTEGHLRATTTLEEPRAATRTDLAVAPDPSAEAIPPHRDLAAAVEVPAGLCHARREAAVDRDPLVRKNDAATNEAEAMNARDAVARNAVAAAEDPRVDARGLLPLRGLPFLLRHLPPLLPMKRAVPEMATTKTTRQTVLSTISPKINGLSLSINSSCGPHPRTFAATFPKRWEPRSMKSFSSRTEELENTRDAPMSN